MIKPEMEEVKKKVDKIILDSLAKNQKDFFHELIKYQIATGGKRIRPFLTIIFFRTLTQKNDDNIFKLAAAIEIFHNYSLLIDDIIDKGELRRKKETSWKKYGESATMCVSSFYFSTILDLLKGFDSTIFDFFSKETKRVMEGELIDVLQDRSHSEEPFINQNKYEKITLSDYFEMVEKKTAALFSLCFKSAAFLSNKEDCLDIADCLGHNLGISFQIKDDILDIFGKEKDFGKKIGKDIKEKKGGNIILLLAKQENKKIEKLLDVETFSDQKIKEIIKEIKKTDAEKRSIELSDQYIKKSLEIVEKIPQNKNRELLKEVIIEISKRDN